MNAKKSLAYICSMNQRLKKLKLIGKIIYLKLSFASPVLKPARQQPVIHISIAPASWRGGDGRSRQGRGEDWCYRHWHPLGSRCGNWGHCGRGGSCNPSLGRNWHGRGEHHCFWPWCCGCGGISATATTATGQHGQNQNRNQN